MGEELVNGMKYLRPGSGAMELVIPMRCRKT